MFLDTTVLYKHIDNGLTCECEQMMLLMSFAGNPRDVYSYQWLLSDPQAPCTRKLFSLVILIYLETNNFSKPLQ